MEPFGTNALRSGLFLELVEEVLHGGRGVGCSLGFGQLTGREEGRGEERLELLSRPLQGVAYLVGEVLQGADGERALWGVPSGAVGLGDVGYHHLRVALAAQSSAL